MKILVIAAGGLAGPPAPELGGKTPLQAARTPALDRLAAEGEAGGWLPAPPGWPPGPGTALQSFFGYPAFVPPGVLEAGGAGLELREGEVAFRANFVCLRPGAISVVMFDPTGCGVSEEDGTALVDYLNAHMAPAEGEEMRLVSLGGHRALFTYRKEGESLAAAAVEGFSPPHEILGEPIGDHLPVAAEARRFVHIVNDSQMILSAHPGLREKTLESMFAANSLWLWGGGGKGKGRTAPPAFPLSEKVGGREAAVVSSGPAAAGIAQAGGARFIRLRAEGSGILREAAEAARAAMGESEFVLLTEEGTGEATPGGSADAAISFIERLDAEVIAPLLENPGAGGPCRIAVLSDRALSGDSPAPYAAADWAAGRLQPPPPAPEGLGGFVGRLFGRGGKAAGPDPERRLCDAPAAGGRPLSGDALRERLLAG